MVYVPAVRRTALRLGWILVVTAVAVQARAQETPAPTVTVPPAEGVDRARSETAAGADHVDDDVAEQLRRRAAIRPAHRGMALTTWFSLGGVAALGTIRYANVYGLFAPPLCATGSPVFGSDFGCGQGLHVWHVIALSLTESNYTVTRILARLMPDPLGAAFQDTGHSRRLWLHRFLSYVHLLGMIAIPGIDLAASLASQDAGTQQLFATAQLITTYVTLGLITIAGALMI